MIVRPLHADATRPPEDSQRPGQIQLRDAGEPQHRDGERLARFEFVGGHGFP